MPRLFAAAALPAAIAAALGFNPANATLQIAASLNGTSFFCADNTACDQNNAPGVLQLANQSYGGVEVNGSLSVASSAGGLNLLDVGSLSVINDNATTVPIQFTVSATGFTPPSFNVQTTGSGTWVLATGSTAKLTWFNDPGNSQGADFTGDTPGDLVDSFSTVALSPADSFAHNGGGPLANPDLDPFSMTLNTAGELTAGGQLLNRGQAEIKPIEAVAEPASLLLLGVGLVGLGLVRHRRGPGGLPV